MKIKVDSSGYRFTIPFPNWLMLNRVTSHVAASMLKQYSCTSVKSSDLHKLFQEVRKAKRIFGKMVLVSVKSSEGDVVEIIL